MEKKLKKKDTTFPEEAEAPVWDHTGGMGLEWWSPKEPTSQWSAEPVSSFWFLPQQGVLW